MAVILPEDDWSHDVKLQAVILVGGKGTRISALFPDVPKALVPVAGKPFIERQIDWLAANGVSDIHLAAGHKAGILREWTAGFHRPGINITLSVEPEPLGTGGGLRYVLDHIRSDPFFVLNGDSLMPNLRLGVMALDQRKRTTSVTIAITRIEHAGRYGTVEFSKDGMVTAFLEKADRASGWINGGVYLMDRHVVNAIEYGRNSSMETDIFPSLAAQGRISAFHADPPLLDMGTPDGLAALEQFVKKPET
jgi:mannose-1-phosphate guanylyltransferase